MRRKAKNIEPDQLGRIVGGSTHTTITIRNDLLPEGLHEALMGIGDCDWGLMERPRVELTKEMCELIFGALLAKLRNMPLGRKRQ